MNQWKYVKLGEVCTIERGGSPRPIDDFITTDENGINWIKIGDADESMYITKTAQRIKPEGMKKSRYVKPGDFLLSNSMSFGRPYILKIDGCIHDGWLVLRDENNVFDKKFLYYYLSAPITYKKFKSMAVGGVVNNLNSDMVRKVRVPMPSQEEQHQISDRLDRVSNLIFLRKQQLAKLDELVKARFVEMFGDPVKNTMDWEIKSLSELGELNRGVSKARPRNSPELLGGPYPLIQTGEVSNAKTYITSFNSTYSEKGLAQSKMWPKGTLCITIAANIAQTSILTFDACFPDSVVGFISRNMTNELFIHYWFSFFQKILDEQAPQVAQKNINLKILSELNVIVPPLALQNQFAAFVERVDQQKQTVQQSLEKLELMKKALMQEYFG